MRLEVGNALKFPGQSYPFAGDLTLEAMDVLGDPVQFEDIAVKGSFVGTGEGVHVDANVEATVRSQCAKCLTEVSQPIKAVVDASFVRVPDPEDPDLYPLDGHAIALDEAVREALLLELPYRFLCKENCRGLCPVCGVNLNLTGCDCAQREEPQGPFAALRGYLIHDEEV